MTRVFEAPRSLVFKAWTEPERIKQWWGPRGFTIPSLDFEPEVGSSYRIEMQPPEGDRFYVAGEFRAVDPPARVAFTFAWEEPDPDDVETLVELSFADLNGSTQLALRQGRFRTEDRRQLHRDGWSDSFDKLERLVSSRA